MRPSNEVLYKSLRKTTKVFTVTLSKSTCSDIIDKLQSVDNVTGYIKSLIRADIAKETETEENRQ